jgi:spermidine synthase
MSEHTQNKELNLETPTDNASLFFTLILSCFFLSGVAGLIYEVLWVRTIDKVIGSAPFAVATVLSIFMGGLALGSYVAGKYIDRIPSRSNLLSLYGKVEVAIGLYALLIPLFTIMVKPIYAIAYNYLFEHFWIYQIFALLGCSLLLILPTSLMGFTLPVLCRFYVTHLDHLGARTGRLYGINTVGAAVGALLCGFVLINSLGTRGTLLVAVAINVSVGLFCIMLGKASLPLAFPQSAQNPGKNISPEKPEHWAPSMETTHDSTITWALWIFAVSGFSSMAYEVIWARLLGLIIGPTTYSFTLVIATFITGLALGSLFFGWLGDRVNSVFPLLAATQLCAACLALLVSQFLGNSQFFFAKLIYTFRDQFNEMILVQSLIVFFILLGPTVLLGATFPLVNRLYARSLPVIGKSIGTAYALNTIGAILGSVAAGFVLIPCLGKENGVRLVMAIQFTLALTASVTLALQKNRMATQWRSLSGMALLGLLLLLSFPSWNRQLLSYGRYRNLEQMGDYLTATSWLEALVRGPKSLAQYETRPEIVFYGDGIGGFTTVEKETDSFGTVKYSLLNSGKPDASSHEDRSTQTLLAHVPMLFHRQPKDVMVLGLASGMTAGEVLLYPIKRLDVLEINAQAVEACEIFTPWNNNCLNDPRTRIIVQDGRNHLVLTRHKYDAIISEPSNPWMAGLANLYTLEFFKTVKEHLREPGIFVQWIHSYEMDWDTFALVGRTFAQVFPDGLLITTLPADHLLVGFSGQKGFNLEVAEKNIKYAQLSKNISLPNPGLLFHMIITEDLKRFFGPGRLHTDNRPRLEFAAPKQLHKKDLPSEERMTKRGWLSAQTKEMVESGCSVDVLIDKIEFLASAYSALFLIPDLNDASLSQKTRFQKVLNQYCDETLVRNYEIFPNQGIKAKCAEIQADKIRQHLASNPGDASGYYDLGLAFEQMGNTAEAIEALQRAIALNPFYVNAYNSLGVIMTRHGRLEEAIRHFSEVLRIKPGDAMAQKNLEVVLRLMNKSP